MSEGRLQPNIRRMFKAVGSASSIFLILSVFTAHLSGFVARLGMNSVPFLDAYFAASVLGTASVYFVMSTIVSELLLIFLSVTLTYIWVVAGGSYLVRKLRVFISRHARRYSYWIRLAIISVLFLDAYIGSLSMGLFVGLLLLGFGSFELGRRKGWRQVLSGEVPSIRNMLGRLDFSHNLWLGTFATPSTTGLAILGIVLLSFFGGVARVGHLCKADSDVILTGNSKITGSVIGINFNGLIIGTDGCRETVFSPFSSIQTISVGNPYRTSVSRSEP